MNGPERTITSRIDDEHNQLILRLNDLIDLCHEIEHDVAAEDRSFADLRTHERLLRRRLTELTNYLAEHFQYEESLMSTFLGQSDQVLACAAHMGDHERIFRDVGGITTSLPGRRPADLAKDVTAVVEHFHSQHLGHHDAILWAMVKQHTQ